MEMPIAVVITLFVCVAIGVGILYFSQDILGKAKNEVNQMGIENDQKTEDKLIKLGSLSEGAIRSLAEQCILDKSNSPDKDLCFIVMNDNHDQVILNNMNNMNITVEGRTFTFVNDAIPDGNSFLMYYNPDGTIEFEG